MPCIFCGSQEHLNTVEHIVPESLGNTTFMLSKGDICDTCNGKFSEFEGKALGKSILGFERARLGHKTKKGKPGKGKTGNIQFSGNEKFKKNLVVAEGLQNEDLKNYDPVKDTYQVRVEGFDKSEVATSKMLLKMGFEALYKSNRKLWEKHNFDELKAFLDGKSNKDWPFITPRKNLLKFTSIPRMGDKHALNKIPCRLLISEVDKDNLIFRFEYGGKGVAFEINLLNRNFGWIKPHADQDNIFCVYPRHFDKHFGLPKVKE